MYVKEEVKQCYSISDLPNLVNYSCFLVVVVIHNWSLQIDVQNDFQYNGLLQEVYMKPLSSFHQQGVAPIVCQLKESLYGLK